MKNLLISLLIIGAFVGGYFFSKNFEIRQKDNNANLPTPIVTQAIIVGSDSDEHGCKASAGYTWCQIKNKCLRTWEETCENEPTITKEDLAKIIQQLLVVKHGSSANSLKVTVSEIEGKYAEGGAAASGGGAMWVAVKLNNNWKLVFDGNGTIECDLLTDYPDLPVSMIPECFNSATMTSVKR